ncbi:ATP-binding protein [Paenibacillus turpanensis]|uniref:ATP-binding protein n=1 Tax=Paenibacillus turpanensis TaxID=2689078 RepID=UPI001408BA4C|nr:ATP-binding protein [Paenibacillus turpanensis]
MDGFVVHINSEEDIYLAISRARYLADGRFTEADLQCIFVTILELTRNALNYAGGRAVFLCERVEGGLQIQVIDKGPGIPNLDDIFNGSYRSPTGLGLGLQGVKRMMDTFEIETTEKGTTVRATKWPSQPRT